MAKKNRHNNLPLAGYSPLEKAWLGLFVVLFTTTELHAQSVKAAPRLVVDITIDQLRTDFLQQFASFYCPDGFRKLLDEGAVFEAASYPFTPVDRASAIAAIATGTTPYYNNIVATHWLDRSTLRPTECVSDPKYVYSPSRLTTSTIGDELKIATNGNARVYAVAPWGDAAILAAGHAADGAFWKNKLRGNWETSVYYPSAARTWVTAFQHIAATTAKTNGRQTATTIVDNDEIARLAVECVKGNVMGRDDVPDYLSMTLSAEGTGRDDWQVDMETVYRSLDHTLADFIKQVQTEVGKDNVLFVVTSTGYTPDTDTDYARYKIPTGTFRIDRTANLLNIFLSAIYGQGRYVDCCFGNQIYLNRKLIEQKRLGMDDLLQRSQEFLIQNSGVRDVFTSARLLRGGDEVNRIRNAYNADASGDIIIEVAPGWQLQNEETGEHFISRASFVPFPIIFFGQGITPRHITSPVTVDRIAPTVAKAIRIRAPNACKAEPLF